MSGFSNILKIPDLRKRVFYTIGCLLVYRIGVHITMPGVNPVALKEMMGSIANQPFGNIVGFIDLFAGGAFKQLTIFALGVMPYISASIIIQLLTSVVPHLEELSKEGEMGRKKMHQYMRYLTVVICIIQAAAISRWVAGKNVITFESTWFFTFVAIVTATTGTIFLMWLGEQITEKGIGNGISLIIFAGISARIPSEFFQTLAKVQDNSFNPVFFLLLLIVFAVIIFFVVYEQQGERRIPIQFARKFVGRKMIGGQNSYIPFKINPTGVIPIIFASAIVMFPGQIVSMLGDRFPGLSRFAAQLSPRHVPYMIVYALLVIFFAYFYSTIQFNPVDIASNLKKQGGNIPGIRPGIQTQEYLKKVLVRITFAGSLFLAIIAILPDILLSFNIFSGVSPGFAYLMGGTSLLILVAVDLDTIKQIEAQLTMREYEGFMNKKKRRRSR